MCLKNGVQPPQLNTDFLLVYIFLKSSIRMLKPERRKRFIGHFPAVIRRALRIYDKELNVILIMIAASILQNFISLFLMQLAECRVRFYTNYPPSIFPKMHTHGKKFRACRTNFYKYAMV